MSFGYSDEEIEVYRETFNFFDRNGDGTITVEELGTVMRACNKVRTDEELNRVIAHVDANENGKLELPEFLALMEELEKQPAHVKQKELVEAFKVFDKNGNGLISADELQFMLQNLGQNLPEDQINEMLKSADINGDGQIDYVEFVKLLGKDGAQSS